MLVICPAFVSDCLETLEEIGLRGRETFLEAGGSDLKLIPCLNEHPLWIAALEKMITRFTTAGKSEHPEYLRSQSFIAETPYAKEGDDLRNAQLLKDLCQKSRTTITKSS